MSPGDAATVRLRLPGAQHPRVDSERVRQLLAAGGESPALDFKRTLDLRNTRQLLALAKDVGAMSARGGDILIGADDGGRLTGLIPEADLELFDEARLRAKLGKWLPPRIAIRTAVHRIDAEHVAIVAVEPHPLGVCIMAADGNFAGGQEFRAGDVFVRRGTQSVRWSETELADFVERTRVRQLDVARSELRAAARAAPDFFAPDDDARRAPLAATSWQSDLDALVEAAMSAVSMGDDVAVRRLLASLPRELARACRQDRAIDRTSHLLDRAAALLAQFLVVGRNDLFEELLRRLAAAYASSLADHHPATPVRAPLLGLMMLERLYAVGGLAVREDRFDLVYGLATQGVRGPTAGAPPFLLAHIQRTAERQDFLRIVDRNRPPHTWVISHASEVATRNAWLRPDIAAEDDRLVTSLCEFDVLCALAATAAANTTSSRLMFGNFAGWFAHRTDPVVRELLNQDGRARQTLFPGTDEALAHALKVLEDTALTRWIGTPPWDGYCDEEIRWFLDEHLRR